MLYFLRKVLRTLMLLIMVSSKSNLNIRWFHFIVCSAIVRSRLKDSKNNPVIKRSQKKEERYYWFHSLEVFHFVCNSTVRSQLKDSINEPVNIRKKENNFLMSILRSRYGFHYRLYCRTLCPSWLITIFA